MQSGAPTFGTPEPALVLYVMAALARRLGVPFRSGGSLCASKVADAQAAYESAATLQPTVLGRRQLRPPRGRLARGRPHRRLREIHHGRRPVRDDGRVHRTASTCPTTARRSTRSWPTSRARTTWAAPTRWPTSRARSTAASRRQQQLRAVAGGRLARRRAAGERHLEEAAGRVRGAAARSRRSTRRCSTSSPARKASMPDSEV